MHDEHIINIITASKIVVYPGAGTRIGSKHIPGIMIPYSPVTEVYTGFLLCGGFDSNV